MNDQDNFRVENKRADVPISTKGQTLFTTNTMGSRRMSGHYRLCKPEN